MNHFKHIFLILITFTCVIQSFGQKERKYIREGNHEYENQKYGNSEVSYQKALDLKPASFEAKYNLGNAQYKQEKYDTAIAKYAELINQTKDKQRLASIYHNIGNSELNKTSKLLKEQKLDDAIKQVEKSIQAYKNSLKNNSTDKQTKYNLQYASILKNLLELEKQKREQNQGKDKQDKNDKNDQKGDKDQQNQNQNDQNKPNQNDSDGDGIPDKTEKGSNQEKPRDTDKDGTPDYKDQDSDNDGKSDAEEAGQQPENPQDTDKDGLPDYRDLDSDNDGKPDSQEVAENEQNSEQEKDQLSKDDAIRLLNAVENDEKNVQDKVKKVKGKKVRKSEKDW